MFHKEGVFMFKWLKNLFRKHSKKLSPENKDVRDLIDKEIKSVTRERKKTAKRSKIMAEETEVKKDEQVATETVEKVEDKGDDKKEDVKSQEKVKATEKTDNSEEQNADAQPQKEPTQVEEVEPVGNGIPLEDVVTKDMLTERLAAFEAKFEAVIKENNDLKNEISAMKDKYEKQDFGTMQKQGVDMSNKNANETFESYSKQFM